VAEGHRQRAGARSAPIAGIAESADIARDRETKIASYLKVLLQVREFFYLKQAQTIRSGVHRLMLQRPREVMRHKDGVDSGGKRRIDV
jgi:hypothetical protein